MVTRTGGMRRKTRNKLSKKSRERGKQRIRAALQTFEEGQRVTLRAEPARQHGMYHPRFHGRSGVVTGQQGECYKVQISDGNNKKILIVHPIHLRGQNE